MLTLAAFVLALAVLITVHEYGHFRVALACGVKVLRFSIGFGKPLYRWQSRSSATEFVIAAFPLGGYVRMLDEREAAVPAQERHLAFNTQPLRARCAIVVAGPLSNLLLAVVLYALVNWIGVQLAAPLLATPTMGSVAEQAGLTGGERVLRAGFGANETQELGSFEDLRWFLTQGALQRTDLRLDVQVPGHVSPTEVVLPLAAMDVTEVNADFFEKIGIVGPLTRPLIGQVMRSDVADRAGLRDGDVVRQVGAVAVQDGSQLRQLIRASVSNGKGVSSVWKIDRAGTEIELDVRPEPRQEGDHLVGKIGAYVGSMPEQVLVRYGAWDGLWLGLTRTWDVSVLTLRMMGKMVVGEASVKNLSGPLTIADYAGKSADMGLTHYLSFLALISVSLGVLNLLPVPVLDGGHLMYYLWEGVTGRSVPDAWMESLQRGGVALLLLMMSVALFNDINRLFG
jgi:regulator of sigma E protease